MKNITHTSAHIPLHGRLRFTTGFVEETDIMGKRVLDIGCGYGWFEVYALSKKVKQVTGIELSDEDLVTARSEVKNRRVRFQIGSAIELPFAENSFDTVVSWEVLEHIPIGTEEKMFSEISRVLKKGGVCYLSTPHWSVLSTALDPAFWLIGHRHYRLSDIRRFAPTAGFTVDRLLLAGGFWETAWIVNLYGSKWILHRKPFLEQMFETKLDHEYAHNGGFTNIFCRAVKL